MEKSISDKDLIDGIIKDDLNSNIDKLKEEKQKKLQIQAELERKKFEKERKQIKRKDKVRKFWQNFLSALNPDTYATFIQNFESLMYVIFVDAIILSLLFSILYGMYIILKLNYDNAFVSLYKIAGITVISVLCIIVQVNLDSKSKSGE